MDNLFSEDRDLQNEAFFSILKETEKPVDWAYEVWDKLVDTLARWFKDCTSEKNWTLIRYDIIQDLRNLYDEVKDESIRDKALELIDTETDVKYRKKYASVWK